jgi:hypothetical protein
MPIDESSVRERQKNARYTGNGDLRFFSACCGCDGHAQRNNVELRFKSRFTACSQQGDRTLSIVEPESGSQLAAVPLVTRRICKLFFSPYQKS